MVLGAPHALTKLGFRRDVKFFLATLVGFLVVLILCLLLLLQNAVLETEMGIVQQQQTIADASALMLERAAPRNVADIRSTLQRVRNRFELAGARLNTADGRVITAGYEGEGAISIERATSVGKLTLGFDPFIVTELRRKFALTAIITVLAVAGGTILLLMFVPRITRPIEALLDQAAQIETHDPAVDEQQYLLETFSKTIATLRRQEEELRRLHDEQKTRADDFERVTAALTRSLSSGFMAADPSGRLVDMNQSGRDILRIDPDTEILGQPIREALPESVGVTLQRAVERRQSLTRVEIETRTRDGRLIVGVSTVPLLNEQGICLGMLALFTDLTPVRDLERRLRDMQTLADLGEMSAGIAHEFRNSLSTILGYLKLAQRQHSEEDARAKMKRAEEEASLLSAAIESLLNFSRPMPIQPQNVDLRELVESAVSRLEPHAPAVEFSIEGTAALHGDRALLSRAIENVLRNAVDAVRETAAPRVEVTLRSDPPSITVRDNGVGLKPEDAARLFLPFQSDRPGGFGLGLPLARKIVLLHGGNMVLTGAPGEGATLRMDFAAGRNLESVPPRPEAREVLR
jgi:signal transduction histidine kinase